MDETAIAFEHPHARASATDGGRPLDRISVRDYTRQVEIGAFHSERGATQRIRFNVVLEVTHHTAAQDDDVDKVVSYDTITEAIEHEIAAERINLLETLAERVAARCLDDPRAARVFVRLEKLDRIPGALGVEIVRSRLPEAARRLRPVEVGPPKPKLQPVVVFLAPEIAADAGDWRDALIDRSGAVVVCLGPVTPQPPAATEPQRRIGLLAIEQAVWAFADRDARFTVAASRTELDWALKSGRPVVWAPTHMATATLQRQAPDASDPLALASWLADEIGATRLLVAGAPVPPGTRGQAITRPRDLADPDVTG